MGDKDVILIDCGQDEVGRYLREVIYCAQGTKSIIVIVDVASSQEVKNRTSELVRLGFSARHHGTSVVVLTQQLTSISKPFRENISKLVMFYNPSREDMDMLFKKYIGDVSTQERQQILQLLKGHKYAHLHNGLC